MVGKIISLFLAGAIVVFAGLAVFPAKAQGLDGTVSSGCVTEAQVVTQEVLDSYKAHNGRVVKFEGETAVTLLAAIAAVVGTEPPFTVDKIIVGIEDDDTEEAFIKFFKDECLVNVGRIPVKFIEQFEKRV